MKKESRNKANLNKYIPHLSFLKLDNNVLPRVLPINTKRTQLQIQADEHIYNIRTNVLKIEHESPSYTSRIPSRSITKRAGDVVDQSASKRIKLNDDVRINNRKLTIYDEERENETSALETKSERTEQDQKDDLTIRDNDDESISLTSANGIITNETMTNNYEEEPSYNSMNNYNVIVDIDDESVIDFKIEWMSRYLTEQYESVYKSTSKKRKSMQESFDECVDTKKIKRSNSD